MLQERTLEALRSAVEFCGYDMGEIMERHNRKRVFSDLRSIVWTIYCDSLHASPARASAAFGWDRTTIHCALAKARDLRTTDRFFADMYDSILGAFNAIGAEDALEEKNNN